MSLLHIFLGEFLGTLVLIFLGNSVVANVTFKGTHGRGGGIITIAWGWALAVFAGICISNIWNTGGFINPAVTVGKWVGGQITSVDALIFIISQFAGAFIGQILVDTVYWQHIKTEKPSTVLGMHGTAPTHDKSIFTNFVTEYLSTTILIAVIFFTLSMANGAQLWFGGAPFVIAMVVLAIGLSLGGTTGYAINPARDLSPRILHWIMYKTLSKHLNVKNNSISSNWTYSWIPVIAPLTAGVTMGAILRLT